LIVPFVVSLSNHNSYFLLLVPMRRMGTPPLPALQAVINMQDGQEMFGDAAHPGCIPMRRMGTRLKID
jgi:hypothetical protein